ncbi:MAG: MBL fold metallo-hydrolase [Clostridia bacterium]|nr:MBL fold metallo-hydrolase [Clostridia bacterium]
MSIKLQFLGTCACDYSEKLKNEFKDCFDYDARRSSSLLIDKKYLVDCGEHTWDSLRISGADASKITNVFITHLHDDHFNIENIRKVASLGKICLWVNENAPIEEENNIEIVKMKPFQKYNVDGDFTITALPSNHDPLSFPVHFLIEKEEKRIFYGCDGAWLLAGTYNFLRNKKLSLMVLDGTVGDYTGDYRLAEHNSIPMIRMMLPSLKTFGVIDETTRVMISHIAPSLHKSHIETVGLLKKDKIEVAYDGQKLEI